MFSYQKCRATFLEKEYECLSLTVKIFLKDIAKYLKLLEDRNVRKLLEHCFKVLGRVLIAFSRFTTV